MATNQYRIHLTLLLTYTLLGCLEVSASKTRVGFFCSCSTNAVPTWAGSFGVDHMEL